MSTELAGFGVSRMQIISSARVRGAGVAAAADEPVRRRSCGIRVSSKQVTSMAAGCRTARRAAARVSPQWHGTPSAAVYARFQDLLTVRYDIGRDHYWSEAGSPVAVPALACCGCSSRADRCGGDTGRNQQRRPSSGSPAGRTSRGRGPVARRLSAVGRGCARYSPAHLRFRELGAAALGLACAQSARRAVVVRLLRPPARLRPPWRAARPLAHRRPARRTRRRRDDR